MSNEVTKAAEEKVENQDSATEQKNTKNSAEKPAEENTTPSTETQETKTVETENNQPQTETEESQNSGEMDFGAMLAQFEAEQTDYRPGDTVKGKIVGISEKGVLIDFGYKSEGVAGLEEFTSSEGETTINEGDEVEVVIKSMRGDAPPVLSYFDAKNRRSWDEIEAAFQEETTIKGKVIDKTKGGLKVDVNGIETFLPGSQIDSRPVRNLDEWKGKEIEAKIVKFSRKRNNIVLSRKILTDEVINKQKAETLSKLDQGYIVQGTIKNLTDYGAFVDIGGIDGLLHVTDMSWGRLNRPNQKFKVGDSVQVKILKLDREKEKISLGFKQLIPDPWSTVAEFYPVEARIKGVVSSVTEYGAFVELEPGVEGLVHITEMSWSKRLKHPKHFVKKGDEVEVQILGIDLDERRISLGIKQLQENPWDTIGIRYQLGSKVSGKVRNLTDFGAFVEIEDGVDGLVHVSDISWSKRVKHPKDILKKGQEVEAIITKINTDERRLSLSIKELTPSAWETFTNEYAPGNIVKGKITRFAGFGVFVELAPDLEGLCHISELSDERIENPEDNFEIGQELDFKILRIEHDTEKIGLSARAVGKDDEPVVDTKTYSSEAKGGMASLGELANLMNLSGEKSEEKETEAPKDKETSVAETEETPVAEVKEETKDEAKDEAEATKDESKDEAKDEAESETKSEEKTSENVDEEAPKENSESKDEEKKKDEVEKEKSAEESSAKDSENTDDSKDSAETDEAKSEEKDKKEEDK